MRATVKVHGAVGACVRSAEIHHSASIAATMERAMTRVHGRPVFQTALRMVAIGVVVGGVAIGRAQAAQERGDDSAIATIEGTIMLRGCVPMPSEIDLRAEPIRVSRLDSEGTVDPRATDLTARIARTAEPRTLRFTIHGVQPSKPYHLTIAQPDLGERGEHKQQQPERNEIQQK